MFLFWYLVLEHESRTGGTNDSELPSKLVIIPRKCSQRSPWIRQCVLGLAPERTPGILDSFLDSRPSKASSRGNRLRNLCLLLSMRPKTQCRTHAAGGVASLASRVPAQLGGFVLAAAYPSSSFGFQTSRFLAGCIRSSASALGKVCPICCLSCDGLSIAVVCFPAFAARGSGC